MTLGVWRSARQQPRLHPRETGTTLRVINTATKNVTQPSPPATSANYGYANASLAISPDGTYVYSRDWKATRYR